MVGPPTWRMERVETAELAGLTYYNGAPSVSGQYTGYLHCRYLRQAQLARLSSVVVLPSQRCADCMTLMMLWLLALPFPAKKWDNDSTEENLSGRARSFAVSCLHSFQEFICMHVRTADCTWPLPSLCFVHLGPACSGCTWQSCSSTLAKLLTAAVASKFTAAGAAQHECDLGPSAALTAWSQLLGTVS